MGINLSKIKKEDMEHIYRWFSDTGFLKYYDYYPPFPLNKDEVDKIFNDYENSNHLTKNSLEHHFTSNLYPTPQTVFSCHTCPGISIFSLSLFTCTSTVLESP
jgi:hypothetical protein